MPNSRSLGLWDRFTINYNIWAFLLAPFYYFAKGMWKRALTLAAIGVVGTIVLTLIIESFTRRTVPTWLLTSVLFAVRANGDYYKKVVQRDNGWW